MAVAGKRLLLYGYAEGFQQVVEGNALAALSTGASAARTLSVHFFEVPRMPASGAVWQPALATAVTAIAC